jgi:hypothetical protein
VTSTSTNDIGDAVFYFKKRVEERIAKDDYEGASPDIIAGLTLLAFVVEARFNFLGYKLMRAGTNGNPPRRRSRRFVVISASCLTLKLGRTSA